MRRAPTLTRAGYQIAASTPLQMMLYFSVPYGLLFAVANQMLFYWKARTFDVPLVVAVVSPMMFWIWFLLEPIRILLGFVGNLRERVAWLGGFWVLTIFPQLCVPHASCAACKLCRMQAVPHASCLVARQPLGARSALEPRTASRPRSRVHIDKP